MASADPSSGRSTPAVEWKTVFDSATVALTIATLGVNCHAQIIHPYRRRPEIGMNLSHGTQNGIHIFADGGFEPRSGNGGWAFAVYCDGVESVAEFGGVGKSSNNEVEILAVFKALVWVSQHAAGAAVTIWSDSVYAVNGCNVWRPVWRNWNWRKKGAHGKARSRPIANAELWQAIDGALVKNPCVAIAWCKGHAGILGNERADGLADRGIETLTSSTLRQI
jgi:ribonuclease HI